MRGWAGAAALSLGLAACSDPAPPAPAESAALVSLATVEPASGGGNVVATGTVRAKRETALSFNSAGRIAAILVDDGDRVARGQLLARLDAAEIDASLAASRADAVRAEGDLRRARELFAKGWVAKSRVEAAEATASAARARVTQGGFDQRYARIVAPGAGVVLKRNLEPGQMVAAGAAVVTVGEGGQGYVLRAPLPDADLVRVKVGQSATVAIAALGPEPLAGRVGEVAGRSDERTGTFEIEVALPARTGLRSGLIGEARIRTGGAASGAVSIPAGAVWQARADEGFVYVVGSDRVARSRLVQLGALGDREVVVTGGLKPGEQVVRSGIDRVRDGGKVRLK